jgi:hypothetical protein
MFPLSQLMVIAGNTATISKPRLFLGLAAVAAVAAALPATGLAARPDVTSTPGQLCGIQGTWVTRTVVDSSKQLSNGVMFSHFNGSFTFVSDVTGKEIEFLATGSDKVSLVDNGDGTYSVVDEHSGSGIRSGGGGQNLGAGHSVIADVFQMPAGGLANANPDVDQYIRTDVIFQSPRHLPGDGGDFCADLVIPTLT